MSEVLRVLFLENDPRDAQNVERALTRGGIAIDMKVVATADNFATSLLTFAPDVVLCDHSGAEFSSLQAFALLHETHPGIPFIVVTGAFNEVVVIESLKAGVEDCVIKDRLERLAPAIRTAIAVREPLKRLTPRQVEVLRLIVSGLSTKDVARSLGVSVKTVETHRATLMRRLGIRDLPALVRYAIRVGLIHLGI